MVKDAEWNVRDCPECGQALSEADMARIVKQAQATDWVIVPKFPEGLWDLSCGHRIECITHRTDSGFNFKLRYWPKPIPQL